MLAEQIRQDQIANDLANASTPGYKADRTAQREFGALLLVNRANGATVGSQSTAVQVDRVETDFTPKPSRDGLGDLVLQYDLEASALLALRQAADAYRKTRPQAV